MSLEERVIDYMRHKEESSTAHELSLHLRVPRHEINRALYKLQEQDRVYSNSKTHPSWDLNEIRPAQLTTTLVVLVDLNHVDDCLDELIPYAERDENLRVLVFSDYRAMQCHPSIQLFQRPGNNTLQIIWKVAEYIMLYPSLKYQFVVATKDQSCSDLKKMVEQYNQDLSFVTSWEELKMFVE